MRLLSYIIDVLEIGIMQHITASHHTLERSGGTIHYWLAGPPDQPLVVLTHGATMDHHMFAPQVSLLAQHYRVLTWDVRGHGLSRPISKGFSIGVAVDDLLAILDHLGYAQATLVGQSMGGVIAQELVFRRPERVTALVVIGSECITMPFSLYDYLMMGVTTTVVHLYPALMLKPFLAHLAASRFDVQIYAYQAGLPISQRDFIRIWEALLTCIHYEPDYRITHPVLLTHGEFDTWGNIKRISPLWAARDPYCRYHVIPRAGHNANQDNPEFFNRLLLEFLVETHRAKCNA